MMDDVDLSEHTRPLVTLGEEPDPIQQIQVGGRYPRISFKKIVVLGLTRPLHTRTYRISYIGCHLI